MGSKPGVMLYFDDLRLVDSMSDADAGCLLRAIIRYSRDGIRPEFAGTGKGLDLVWPFFERAVERDNDRYLCTVRKRQYASYCRYSKERGVTPSSFEAWEKERIGADASIWMPTPTPNPNPTPTPNPKFMEFWKEYPLQVDEEGTRKAYEAALLETDADTLLRAVRVQKQSDKWRRENGKFIPYPVNWLKRKGWKLTPAKGFASHGGELSLLEQEAVRKALELGKGE